MVELWLLMVRKMDLRSKRNLVQEVVLERNLVRVKDDAPVLRNARGRDPVQGKGQNDRDREKERKDLVPEKGGGARVGHERREGLGPEITSTRRASMAGEVVRGMRGKARRKLPGIMTRRRLAMRVGIKGELRRKNTRQLTWRFLTLPSLIA